MEVNDLISMVTPEIYQRLSTAVELGKMAERRCTHGRAKRALHANCSLMASAE